MKISHLTHSLTLLSILFFSTACSENDTQITELDEPLNCVYPSDLSLDSRTTDAMSKYKNPAFEDRIIDNQNNDSSIKPIR